MLQIKNGEILTNPTQKYGVEGITIRKANPTEKMPEFDKDKKCLVDCILKAKNNGKFDVERGKKNKSFQLIDLSNNKHFALLETEVLRWDQNIEIGFKLILNKTDNFNLL